MINVTSNAQNQHWKSAFYNLALETLNLSDIGHNTVKRLFINKNLTAKNADNILEYANWKHIRYSCAYWSAHFAKHSLIYVFVMYK